MDKKEVVSNCKREISGDRQEKLFSKDGRKKVEKKEKNNKGMRNNRRKQYLQVI